MLQVAAVEEHTLVLLRKLMQLPFLSKCKLVGGTSLALQIGHRKSIDLDFFGELKLESSAILDNLYSNDIRDVVVENESDKIHVFRIENIKVDMVDYPFSWLDSTIEHEQIRLAGLKDIAAMKLEAITNRGSKKDFVDLFFLLNHFSIQEMLSFYSSKFSHGSPYNVIRSLSYFEDAEVQAMPEMLIPATWDKIKTTIKNAVRAV